MHRKLFAVMALTMLSGCIGMGGGVVTGDVPQCNRLIPASLLAETPPADLPQSAKLADGHDDARPWQAGFIEQTGQLEVANTKAPAIDHIYTECLRLHSEALAKTKRGFFGRLFGG